MADPKDLIGEAGVKALADAGYTITPPKAPEPVRLVTMEESAEAYRRAWDEVLWPQNYAKVNAADNWLVRTVNRRIIEGLPDEGRFWVGTGSGYSAYRHDLLRIFCGKGT